LFLLLFADLQACVWLEEKLNYFECILVVISRSQDSSSTCRRKPSSYTLVFMTNMCKPALNLEENQMKKYKWEMEHIANMKEYITPFGHGSAKKLACQARKEKTLAIMECGGLAEKVVKHKDHCVLLY
jgi:hypothetical protein